MKNKAIRKRPFYTGVWLNGEEYERLQYLCEKTGMTRAALYRRLLTQVELRERINSDYHELLWHIDKIGNNLNQIARRVNSKGLVTNYDIEEVCREVKCMRREFELWKHRWKEECE